MILRLNRAQRQFVAIPADAARHSVISIVLACAIFLAPSISGAAAEPAEASNRSILLVIEAALQPEIQASLDQYQTDLRNEGYVVQQVVVEAGQSPHDIRGLLQSGAKTGLEGAVLVGDIPALMFNSPGQEGNPYWHDCLCDAYYADLDGRWSDRNDNGVYDTREGDYDAEIWVSRIKPNNPALGRTRAELIREYFARNHAYRTGTLQRPPPRAFVVWTKIDVMQSTSFGCQPALLFGDNVEVFGGCGIEGAADKLRKFLSDEAGYELGIINCVTFAGVHHFHPDPSRKTFNSAAQPGRTWHDSLDEWGQTDHGREDISAKWIAQARPKTPFYHMLTSEPGRHDVPDYLCGAYLFASSALTMIAGAQHSGAVGAPNIYPDLAVGKTFGEAWRDGLNYGFAHQGEPYVRYFCWEEKPVHGTWSGSESMHTKAVLHGDGTLRLRSPQTRVPDKREVDGQDR